MRSSIAERPRLVLRKIEQKLCISSVDQDQATGRTVLATIKPTKLLSLFDTPAAAGAAREIEATITRITEEAARG